MPGQPGGAAQASRTVIASTVSASRATIRAPWPIAPGLPPQRRHIPAAPLLPWHAGQGSGAVGERGGKTTRAISVISIAATQSAQGSQEVKTVAPGKIQSAELRAGIVDRLRLPMRGRVEARAGPLEALADDHAVANDGGTEGLAACQFAAPTVPIRALT